jgi:predicted MFS family arabinose efflux permease
MWRTPGLLPLFVAKLISTCGSWLTVLALPWFVLVTTGSPVRMSAVLTAEFLGVVLLGLPSGRLVERLGVRRTMLLGDAARVPLMASIPLLHQAGWLSLPALLAVSFGLGIFTAPYVASQRLILADLLGPSGADEGRLARANSLIDAATRIAALAGPAVGGVLIAVAGPAEVLWIDAGTYGVSFLILLFFVHPPTPARPHSARPHSARPHSARPHSARPHSARPHSARPHPAPPAFESRSPRVSPPSSRLPTSGDDADPAMRSTSMSAGLRYALRHRVLRRFLLALVLVCVSIPAITACLPVLVVREMGGDPRILGLLTAANGAGLAIGSVVAVAGLARMGDGALAGAAVLLSAPLWLLLTGRTGPLVAALFLVGVATPVLAATVNTRFTLRTPVELRPQAMTAMATVENLAYFVAFATAGPALQAAGLGPVFAAIAILAALGAIAFVAALRADHEVEAPPTRAESRA